jgi:hypothetical protein
VISYRCTFHLELYSRSTADARIQKTYGYSNIPLLISLSSLGLLTRPLSTRSPFASVRKPLRLIVDDVDEQAPEDVSYTYSGYAPLTARLVQSTLSSRTGGAFTGWKGAEDVLKNLPGKTFEDIQRGDGAARGRSESFYLTSEFRALLLTKSCVVPPGLPLQDQPPVTLVCFLGGCTYTEIAALRFISKQQKGE